jgi:hypothetical protein
MKSLHPTGSHVIQYAKKKHCLGHSLDGQRRNHGLLLHIDSDSTLQPDLTT